eukprot:GHVS01025994.1.p1 GENE.GHVS01025994.1~~GHVS01025994.1.p1  ORF type:complete len:1031 (+),score=67.84 GHVS01025994.1:151-3243(+)
MAPLTTVGRFFLAPLVVVLLMFDYATATTMEEAGKIADALAIEARLRGNFSRVITKDMTIAPSQKVKFFVSEGFAKAAVGTTVIAPMENAIRRCKLVQTFKKTYREASGENIIDLLLIHLNDAKEHHALFAFLNGEEGQVFKLRATSQESHEFTDALDLTGVGAKDIVKLVGEYKVFPGSTGGELNLKFYKHKVILYINSGTIGIVRECTFGWSENNFFFQLTVDLPRDDEMSVHITYKKDGGVLSEVKYSIVSQGAPEVQGHVGPAASPHTQREASPQPRGSLVRSPLGFTDSAPARGGVQCPASGGQPLRTPVPAPRPSRAQPVVQSATDAGIAGASATVTVSSSTLDPSVQRRDNSNTRPQSPQATTLLDEIETGVCSSGLREYLMSNPVDVPMAKEIAERLLGFAGVEKVNIVSALSAYIEDERDVVQNGVKLAIVEHRLASINLRDDTARFLKDVKKVDLTSNAMALDLVVGAMLDYRFVILKDVEVQYGWRVAASKTRPDHPFHKINVFNVDADVGRYFFDQNVKDNTFCTNEMVELIASLLTSVPVLRNAIASSLRSNKCKLAMAENGPLEFHLIDDHVVLGLPNWSEVVSNVESERAVESFGANGKRILFNTENKHFALRLEEVDDGIWKVAETKIRNQNSVLLLQMIDDVTIPRRHILDHIAIVSGSLETFSFADMADCLAAAGDPINKAISERLQSNHSCLNASSGSSLGFYMVDGSLLVYVNGSWIERVKGVVVRRFDAAGIAVVNFHAANKHYSIRLRKTEGNTYKYESYANWTEEKAKDIANLMFHSISNRTDKDVETIKPVFIREIVANEGLLVSADGSHAVLFFQQYNTSGMSLSWMFVWSDESRVHELKHLFVLWLPESFVVYNPVASEDDEFLPMMFSKELKLHKLFSEEHRKDALKIVQLIGLRGNIARNFMARLLADALRSGSSKAKMTMSIESDTTVIVTISDDLRMNGQFRVLKHMEKLNIFSMALPCLDLDIRDQRGVTFTFALNHSDNGTVIDPPTDSTIVFRLSTL